MMWSQISNGGRIPIIRFSLLQEWAEQLGSSCWSKYFCRPNYSWFICGTHWSKPNRGKRLPKPGSGHTGISTAYIQYRFLPPPSAANWRLIQVIWEAACQQLQRQYVVLAAFSLKIHFFLCNQIINLKNGSLFVLTRFSRLPPIRTVSLVIICPLLWYNVYSDKIETCTFRFLSTENQNIKGVR